MQNWDISNLQIALELAVFIKQAECMQENFTPIVSGDSFQDLKYLHVLIRIFLKIERDSKRRIHNNGTIVTAQRPSQFRTS